MRESPAGPSRGWRRGLVNGAGRGEARARVTGGGARGKDGVEVAHTSGGAKVAHTGGGRQFIYARDRAEVAPASDGRGGPRAHDVDGRRWVRGERGDARADGLEASSWSGDDTLGSVVEGRQRAAGPTEWHGQT